MAIRNTTTLDNINISDQSILTTTPDRMSSLDVQRGVVLMLMAFCHSREFGIDNYSNLDWNKAPEWVNHSLLDLIQQAFMSMIAAGGFFMLLGVGVTFFFHTRLKQNWSLEKILHYLILRGMLFIGLQLTILQFFECISQHKIFFYAGVLMSLGFDLIFAAFVVYCSHKLKNAFLLPIALMLVIFTGLQLLINHLVFTQQAPGLWTVLLFTCGHYHLNNFELAINFTPIPWLAIVLFGVVVGEILQRYQRKGFKIIGYCALSFFMAWFVLRYLYLHNLISFGDYKHVNETTTLSWASYLCMSKYPPSIVFFLWTCSINLSGIYLIHFIEQRLPKIAAWFAPVQMLGQTALIFFVLHWFIYYGLSLLLREPFSSLPGMMFFWLLGLVVAYPLCQAFHQFRMQQAKTSMWRML